ncbi:MAG TPA: endonuclease III, partial [Planctomycetota bacterium]|nr:endonuclease III [Planctomycetota bacterium]
NLFAVYPSPAILASAPPRDVERLIRSIGFYRNKAKHIIETSRMLMAEHGGKVPESLEELLRFPGVGRKVANCVLIYAFGKPAIAVDTHVHRVSNRLGWVKTKEPNQTERALERILPRRHWLELNELLVAHGKAVCRPGRPRCSECGVAGMCPKVGVAPDPGRRSPPSRGAHPEGAREARRGDSKSSAVPPRRSPLPTA